MTTDQTDAFADDFSSLDMQIRCVRREIAMRESVYPRWVQAGRMTQNQAAAEIQMMTAVLDTLTRLKESENG